MPLSGPGGSAYEKPGGFALTAVRLVPLPKEEEEPTAPVNTAGVQWQCPSEGRSGDESGIRRRDFDPGTA